MVINDLWTNARYFPKETEGIPKRGTAGIQKMDAMQANVEISVR